MEADTFSKLLLHHARTRGDSPAIREKDRGIWRTTNWRELGSEVAALAAALAARGVVPGSHVALLGDNRPRLHAALCAAHRLGAVAVPLYQDAAADELVAPLQSAAVTHAFAENQEQVDKLLSILPRCPALATIIYDADRGMRHYKQPQLASYDSLLQHGRTLAPAAEAGPGNADDAAFLFFTAGSTGAAKGVVLSHAALIDRARVAAKVEGLDASDVAMAYLPPGWIAQALFSYVQPLVVGCAVCCPESSETMLADMREVAPSVLLAPPRVLEALLSQVSMRAEDAGPLGAGLYRRCLALARRVGPQVLVGEPVAWADRLAYRAANLLIYGPLRDVLGMSRLRVAYTAGDAIDPELLMFFRGLGVNLKQLYGSTETGYFVALQRNGAVAADAVGTPLDGVELKFSAEREILVRSPGLFKAYHRDPQATARARTDDGYFRTGDAGWLGDDGQLRIIDRLADVGALHDGTPYAPRLLENKLKFGPHIKEAVAFGAGRDRVCMLVDIDLGAVGRWADRQNIAFTGHADLASRDEVYALVAAGIASVNAQLAAVPAQARLLTHRFAILPKALDADDGVLTRTGKLKRAAIAERFAPIIEALYDGRSSVVLDDGTRVRVLEVGAAAAGAQAAAKARPATARSTA